MKQFYGRPKVYYFTFLKLNLHVISKRAYTAHFHKRIKNFKSNNA